MKTTEQKIKAKAKKASEAHGLLAVAAQRAATLTKTLREAHTAACRENGLLAMVLQSRMESAVSLQRKLENIRNCINS